MLTSSPLPHRPSDPGLCAQWSIQSSVIRHGLCSHETIPNQNWTMPSSNRSQTWVGALTLHRLSNSPIGSTLGSKLWHCPANVKMLFGNSKTQIKRCSGGDISTSWMSICRCYIILWKVIHHGMLFRSWQAVLKFWKKSYYDYIATASGVSLHLVPQVSLSWSCLYIIRLYRGGPEQLSLYTVNKTLDLKSQIKPACQSQTISRSTDANGTTMYF